MHISHASLFSHEVKITLLVPNSQEVFLLSSLSTVGTSLQLGTCEHRKESEGMVMIGMTDTGLYIQPLPAGGHFIVISYQQQGY